MAAEYGKGATVLAVELHGRVIWAVRPGDPLLFGLGSLPGWSLLNPATYPEMDRLTSPGTSIKASATFVNEGSCYYVSEGFFLVSSVCNPEQSLTDWAMHHVPALVAHLRSASKQAPLSAKLRSVGFINVDIPTSIVLPRPGQPCATQSWHLRTAIRAEHVGLAGRQLFNGRPPSYDTLLLDAIDSLHQEDFAKAFLLAAISIDHLTNMQANLAFKACLQQQQSANLSIALPAITPEERTEREGLLLELLIYNRRFQDLLKKVLPALTGRYLVKEDQALYRNACDVYRLRNSVVHKELAFREDMPRFVGSDEATHAIRTAVGLAEWFGVPASYAYAYDRVPPPVACHSAQAPK